MRCDGCHKTKPTSAAVLNGKYGQYCEACRYLLQRSPSPRSAQYARDRDREAHEADLVQPWDAKGNVNPEFIKLYPEEAKLNYSQEELEKYG